MSEEKVVEGQFKYDRDSKRYHRFQIQTGPAGIVGIIYVPKNMNRLPDKLVLDPKQN